MLALGDQGGAGMPFYRYECTGCKTEFRVMRRTDEKEPAVCPHCGKSSTKRLLPRIGVIYKGKGYYSTDYRKTKTDGASRSGPAESTPASDD
jgi:putative FmdB family regulatory protein